MPTNAVPLPLQDPIARPARPEYEKKGQSDPLAGTITDSWVQYFTSQGQTVSTTAQRVQLVAERGQSASIATTDMAPGTITGGIYRIQSYIRITTAASVSSSVQLAFTFTDHGQAVTITLAAITGNTVTTTQSAVSLFYADAGTPVTYAVTYSSVGATSAVYQAYLLLEQIVNAP